MRSEEPQQQSGVREQTTEVIGSATDVAREQAGEAVQKGRGLIRNQVDERSTRAGQQAQSLAGSLRDTATQMRSEGDPDKVRLAHYADQGADRLDRVGSYLTEADADELLGKVEDVARDQPWLIAGAGLLIGIAAARFMKASSRERYELRYPAYTRRPDTSPRPTVVGTPPVVVGATSGGQVGSEGGW